MTTTTWTWPGARWWRCDLHTHSPNPGSDDWDVREKGVTADEWIDAAKSKGIEVIALTDHNGGRNVDAYKTAAAKKGVVLLPGVELTVRPGVHLLVVFAPTATSDHVNNFVGQAGIAVEKWGKKDALAAMDVLPALALAKNCSALTIAAHVDEANGVVFEHVDEKKPGGRLVGGQTLIETLKSEHLDGVEVTTLDPDCLAFIDGSKQAYARDPRPLTQVRSSDAHRLADLGQRSTWIKMSTPALDGLAFALWDGIESVQPCDGATDPNAQSGLKIERIEIANALRMGNGQPLAVAFNPWLNALIGGRGSGKSSILEFLRLACGRQNEVPDGLEKEKARYFKTASARGDDGLLRSNYEIIVYFRKDGGEFRVRRSDRRSSIEERKDDAWVETVGTIADRFPIRVFGQKEIFELANDPGALLGVVDSAPEIGKARWRDRWEAEEQRFVSLRSRTRELAAQLADEPRILADLADTRRRLELFEKSGHVRVLKAFGRARRQEAAIEQIKQVGTEVIAELTRVVNAVAVPSLDGELFASTDTAEAEVLMAMAVLQDQLNTVRETLAGAARDTRLQLNNFERTVLDSRWPATAAEARREYAEFTATLAAQGVADPGEYGRLVQHRALLESKAKEFTSLRATMTEHANEANESLSRLRDLRRELTAAREQFLAEHAKASKHVRLRILPYGRVDAAERELRERLRRDDGFADEIGSCDSPGKGLLGDAFGDLVRAIDGTGVTRAIVTDFETRLDTLKAKVVALAEQEASKKGSLANHIRERVKGTDLDRVLSWFPEDSIEASYSPSADGVDFKPIQAGSPGQRTAALLAFLMSYGTEPLILDQPEDDLDNELVHTLIVQQLRAQKGRRQIIVATHNPNIVVNAAAELVIALSAGKGQTFATATGALHESDVRDAVCKIMEGGRQALQERYRRILGPR